MPTISWRRHQQSMESNEPVDWVEHSETQLFGFQPFDPKGINDYQFTDLPSSLFNTKHPHLLFCYYLNPPNRLGHESKF